MEKITLCIVPTCGIEAHETEILTLASPARRDRYASLTSPEMKREYLASTMALARALGAAALSFRYGERGRPLVDGAQISLTHTQGAAACALGAHPLGVDMENRARRLSDVICARLKLCPDAPLDDWLARECYLKMTGEGLGGGIDRQSLQGDMISGAHVRFMDIGALRCAVCCREEFEICVVSGSADL